jgi:D-lactate dehydrogenase
MSAPMRVAVFGAKSYDREYFNAHNRAGHELIFFSPELNEDTVAMVKKFEAVCIFANDKLTAKVIKKLAKAGVKLVALRCTSSNNVDLEAAKHENIAVCSVPAYRPHTIAEHVVSLVLHLNRKVHRGHARVQEKDYSLDGLLGFELRGKTVGIVGTGPIGTALSQIMHGFGCRVLAYDEQQNKTFEKYGEYTDIQRLWHKSDIVSLHCPLIPPTYHLIDVDSIDQMKTGVMLINTSRGGLLDIDAVIQALKSKKIGALGVDIFEEEGGVFSDEVNVDDREDPIFARLATFPNVVVTGHQAYFSRESLAAVARETLASIDAFAKGRLDKARQITV